MFSATKDKLAGALALINTCVSSAHPLPAYQHVLVEGCEGDLWLTGSDGQVTVVTGIETTTDGDFAWCLPGKQFIDLVGMLGGEFSAEEANGRILIEHGRSKHRMPFLPRAEFPEVQMISGESLAVSGNLLRRMMEATEIAVDTKPDGKFPAMRGLNLSVSEGQMHIVGCDGVRLAAASHPMEGNFEAVVPSKAVTVFSKFAEGPAAVEIIPMENHVCLRGERGNVIASRLVGAFPNWKLAIPKDLLYHAEISVPALVLAIRRVGLASNIRDSATSPAFSLKFTFSTKSTLQIEAKSPEKGEAIETIDVDCPGLEEEMVIGVAGRQVLDFLGILDTGHIFLDFKDPVTGLVFRPKQEFGFQYRYVTMPVALKW